MLLNVLLVQLRNIVRNRRRAVLSVGAIVFGVVALLLVGGFNEWSFWNLRETTIRSQLGHIQVARHGYRENGFGNPDAYVLPLTLRSLPALSNIPDVLTVAGRLSFSGLLSHGESTISVIGEGVEPDRESALSGAVRIVVGDNLSAESDRDVVLGKGLAANLGVTVGDTVVILVSLSQGGSAALEAKVAGLFETTSKAYDDVVMRLPLRAAMKLMRYDGPHVWVMLLADTSKTDAVASKLSTALAGLGLEVSPWHELADYYKKAFALFAKQLMVVKLIIGVIIVLSISNTMNMSIMERTGEIGTSLALGNRRKDVLLMFIVEGLLLGVLGVVAGSLIGLALGSVISAIGIPLPPAPGMDVPSIGRIFITLDLWMESCLIALVTTLVASIYPAWKASRLVIVDALRFNR